MQARNSGGILCHLVFLESKTSKANQIGSGENSLFYVYCTIKKKNRSYQATID